ncbi:MAG: hypothetical protein Q9167_004869 [Letrouitia subvulpina]
MTEQIQLDAAAGPHLLADELNQSLRSGFLHSGEYESVNVLLMHWEDDDLGCLEELNMVKSFFEDSWHYNVHILSIPSERSQAALQSDLSQFILLYGSTVQSLLVIYYAGHGDPSLDRKRAIWAAKRKEGPILNWYEVQPVVFAAEGDVLLILDCCYAAQAARGRESRTIELLAASGVKQRTPQPGDYSFTVILIRVMRRMLQEAGYIVLDKLYERLFRETAPDEELVEQPFHFFIAEGGGSIVLKPKAKSLITDRRQDAWPSALLSLTVSLSQKPDRSTMRRLGVWLKTAVPRTISSVDVERVLLHTETIQQFLLARRNSSLQTAIQSDFNQYEQNEPPTHVSASLTRARVPLQGSWNQAEDVLMALKEWNDNVHQSIERHLLLDPAFASHKSLTQLEGDKSAQVLGLDKAARLRMLNMEDGFEPGLHDLQALPYGAVKTESAVTGAFSKTKDKGGRGITTGVLDDDRVWVELLPYESENARDQGIVSAKVKRLASLFAQAANPAFLLAPCLGYIHEPLKNRFGLVFRVGPRTGSSFSSQHMTLQDAIGQRGTMPLNRRIRLAFALSRALSALHAVGWVHKSLCSENIVFSCLSGETSDIKTAENIVSSLDLDSPRLLGFESARPTDAISSQTREYRLSRLIYTHPERWGRPNVTFEPLHDLYALGIILLEVGCWKQASRMDPHGREFNETRNENKVRDQLLAVAREQLPHRAGESYSQAVTACLDGSLANGLGKGSEELDLHKAFGRRVLIPLGRCTYV